MITGMIIFMASMALIQGLVAVFFDDFSMTWVPPVMSVTEMLFVGYGLITSRFYSSRYMLFLLTANVLTGLLLYLPVAATLSIGHHLYTALIYALLSGLIWKRVLKRIKPYVSLLLYRSPLTPAEKINGLIDEFKSSPHDALEKLAHLLNVPENRMQLVRNTPDDTVLDDYFSHHKDVLILEELLDKINATKGKETLDKLHQRMNQDDAAFILPMFNSTDSVSHYLMATHKSNGKLFSAEELNALKKVFKEAQFYINADLQVKQAQSLAHSIAHEMRNPLGQLLLHFEQLQVKLDNNTSAKALCTEINSGKETIERGKQLINMILREVSHSTLAQESMSVSSISRLILQAFHQFSFESEAVKSRVSLNTQADFTVRANDILFNFVIFNLLRNAVYYFDAFPESTVQITTRQDSGSNRVIIRDNGPGIPDHVKKQIFDEFYSFHKDGGSGLGLSYCRRVMESFAGTIECNSEYGEYTEFHLVFPALSVETATCENPPEDVTQAPAEPAVRASETELKTPAPACGTHGLLSKQTILVVDDNKTQRTLVKLFLNQLGYPVVEANNGKAALEVFREKPVDLVIMDIQMPIMNGYEATQKLRQLSPKIPVIALSGESGEPDLKRMSELMDGRLTKPTTKTELQKMLNHCFAPQSRQENICLTEA